MDNIYKKIIEQTNDLKDNELKCYLTSIFKGCGPYITDKRIKKLEEVGFKRKTIYCTTNPQKALLAKVKSGDMEINETYIRIYLGSKKYNLNFLEKDLKENKNK